MLESLVATLLNRFLGMYVRNFDAKQLNVGIWSGDVKLHNLELRRETLDRLHLPLNVVEGRIGSLTLAIPWSNLRGKPVRVSIEDVFILAAPREDADYDPEEDERRQHALKMEKLDSAELLKQRNTEGMSSEEQKKSQSFTASLVSAIVDNLQVSVKNVHVRYEDSISDPGHPFALGLTLQGFDAVSTDDTWRPTFIQSTSGNTHKLASLNLLAVYWDTDATLIGTGIGSQQAIEQNDWADKLKAMIVKGDSPKLNEHQFILKPVTGRAGLEMDKTGKNDRPKMKAKLLFDELGFIIDDDQYRDALMLVDLFHYFIRHQEYKKHQPKSKPDEDPVGWIRFAGKAVLDKIHDRNRRWSWEFFKERRDDRKRYIELFKKRKKEEKFTPKETSEIEKLERKLSYEDLRFWRSLARNQLRKENIGVKKEPKKQTWTQWVWGGGKSANDAADDHQMSDEQRKELYDAIDFDEQKAITESVDMPKEYVQMQVELSLRTGSFTLKRDPHGQGAEILCLLFDSFRTEFFQRTDSLFATVSLEGMRLYDGTTVGSLFPQVIKIKDAPPVIDDKRIEELNDDENSKEKGDVSDVKMTGPLGEDEDKPEDPFFHLSLEKNPLDGSADLAVTVKLKAMEYLHNPNFIVEVVKFFKPPERNMESIGALMQTAGATVEGIRQQTRAGLEYALEEHKTINAQFDVQAPLIIIPNSVTEEAGICLIIDAGHASVSSELVDKATLRDIQNKQQKQYTEADFKKLENLMYDRFQLKLDSTQVLIGKSIEETKAQLDHTKSQSDLHIIDRINVDFTIAICIVPKASDLTKFKISGHLPVLHASVSDSKYKSLMKLIDVAIPKFDKDEKSGTVQEGSGGPSNLKRSDDDKDALGRSKRQSFQRSKESDLVVDDEESDDNEESDGNKEETTTSKETKQDPKTPDVPVHQRNFEFKFTVDKLQGSLYKSDAECKKADELLVELIAEHFYLDFYQRPFDMAAEVKLRTLVVEDHIEEEPIPEFKNIVSSDVARDAKQKDLFQLKFVKVNKESPEFKEKYDSNATNLDVSVSTINLVVTRKTLLTLLDFVLLTFAGPGNAPDVSKEQKQLKGRGEDEQKAARPDAQDPDKIRIKADLKRIALILNNDGIRLATLALNSADVGVFLAGPTMKVMARLGNFSLVDDVNQGVSEDSPLRQLVTIEGKELADFQYETYDPESEAYPGHDTLIHLHTGSLKVNFLTEPFRKIMEFGVKFGKMQAIFNAARSAAAEQASKVQEKANKLHFDILIRSPIVVFHRMVITDRPVRDSLTAYLGEIYAKNSFETLDASKDSVANKIQAGVNNIHLVSLLHYDEDQSEELEMIDKVDVDFKISYVEHRPDADTPNLEVDGTMSDINLKLTTEQIKFALELSRTIPQAFQGEDEDDVQAEVEDELPDETVKPAQNLTKKVDSGKGSPVTPSRHNTEISEDPDTWTKLDLMFKVGAIGLDLIKGGENGPVGDLRAASLSQFSLNDTRITLRMVSDGALESELLIQSFTITDSREMDSNKFRKIMSLINTDIKQQFTASVTISGGEDKHMIALLTIDSPRVILALDYLFAVQAFVNKGLEAEEPLQIEGDPEEERTDGAQSDVMITERHSQLPEEEADKDDGMAMSFRIELVDAQIILIANPSIHNSEAIVLGTKQVIVAKQHAITLQVDRVGMFLCRMDQFETSKLRILDDFGIQTALDMRNEGRKSSLMSINVNIDPLVLRLSLRDILLAMQIFSRASEMNSGGDGGKTSTEQPKKLKELEAPKKDKKTSTVKGGSKTNRALAGSSSTKKSQRPAQLERQESSGVIKREEMSIEFQGIRVVLIGDKHELPMLDWSVKKFGVQVRDWSGAMTADTSIDTFFNVYNFSKSAWEPLIEPWQLGFHMSKEQHPDKLLLDLYSRKSMELTITSATIALASKSADFLTTEEDILSKPRKMDAPYRIRNQTGFDVNVWAVGKPGDEGEAKRLADGEETPWRFEDPMTTRETLSPDGATGIVGIRLEGSGFDSVVKIPVNREGETLFNLKPRKDKVQHRMLVEVTLGADNIKNITFRSPLLVENNTQIPVELGVLSPEEGHILKIEKIPPGDSRPAPVGAAFMNSLLVRPDQGFGYDWNSEKLFWKDLLKRPTRTLTCHGEDDDRTPVFFFQVNAAFDKKDPLTGVYPYMRIKLAAPVEVQNLLPFDFKYRIFDNNTKKDWTNFLRKGGVSPVHVVELSHLLMLSIDLQDTPFKQSEFTTINSSDREFPREKEIVVKDNNALPLRLKLHYYNVPDGGGAFKVTVYSPYVLLNRTGIELDVRSKAFMGSSKAAAGQSALAHSDSRKPTPFMFSFPSDDRKNRALLKIGNSQWSKPQSFDAIGSTYNITLLDASGRLEMHTGVTVEEGEGKYNLSKVVTIAPRYIINNRLEQDLQFRAPGSSDYVTLKAGALLPLRWLRQNAGQQLCLCFSGVNNQWSSPFNISNVGNVHVKLAGEVGQRQKLIRIDILMEQTTIFLHISIETKHWPFSMRNESNTEFMFFQTNPHIDEDEEDRGSGWKPIRYKLPPRSVMPYAWDYPAAKNKEIVITAHGKDRHVKLVEIGNPPPMRLPPTSDGGTEKTIDINIIANGPTQTLVLSNFKQSKSLYKVKTGANISSTATSFEIKEQDMDTTVSAQLRLAGFSISLVNSQIKELVYMTLRDIELKYIESPLYQTLKSTIKWIQIDNQLYGGIFPIIFYPSVVPKTGKEMEAHPILHSAITRVKDDSYGVLYIKYFTVLLQQLTIEIDEDFIFALLDFAKVPGASWSEPKEGKLGDENLDLPEPKQEQSSQDIYFEFLHLQPMQFDLSFVRTERINAEDTSTSNSPFMFAVNVLTMSIGNVNDAPIRYNALMLENARVSVGSLINSIKTHYVQESLRQVHLVIGSADFLGNPVGLFNNVTSGIQDIFYEPYHGMVMTDRPQDLGIGIAKGASSFVKKSVFGLSDSMAKFTGSMSKGLSAATMDKEFQDQRRMSRSRNLPKHALYGITSGGNAFASSLASGIGGLARHPLEGLEKEGTAGLFKGVGKGLLGLATKPAIGAFDLASNMAEGVRNSTTVFDQEGLDRVRLTRFIGVDGIVRPYSQREALGQFWLKTLNNGKYFSEDYLAHLELPGKDMLVMLTYNGMMLVRTKKLTTEWDVPLKDIHTISKEWTGMSITLKGGTNGPFIPVQDEESRNWLYRQVAVAVNAYNDKWEAKG